MKVAVDVRRPPGRPKGTVRGVTQQNRRSDRSKGGSLVRLDYWIPRELMMELQRAAVVQARPQNEIVTEAIRSRLSARPVHE